MSPRLPDRLMLRVALIAGMALVPWAIYLSDTLQHHVGFWVGLDALESAAALTTAALIHAHSRYAAWSARVGAALLLLDAWVDVRSSARHGHLTTALAMALLVEIPLAIGAVWWARRYVRPRARAAYLMSGGATRV